MRSPHCTLFRDGSQTEFSGWLMALSRVGRKWVTAAQVDKSLPDLWFRVFGAPDRDSCVPHWAISVDRYPRNGMYVRGPIAVTLV
jgi:hypothetical protein